jgi:hypothetical protein
MFDCLWKSRCPRAAWRAAWFAAVLVHIHSLGDGTAASFQFIQFMVLNQKRCMWLMVAGGRASVIYAGRQTCMRRMVQSDEDSIVCGGWNFHMQRGVLYGVPLYCAHPQPG